MAFDIDEGDWMLGRLLVLEEPDIFFRFLYNGDVRLSIIIRCGVTLISMPGVELMPRTNGLNLSTLLSSLPSALTGVTSLSRYLKEVFFGMGLLKGLLNNFPELD
jgi:hypothetical protein